VGAEPTTYRSLRLARDEPGPKCDRARPAGGPAARSSSLPGRAVDRVGRALYDDRRVRRGLASAGRRWPSTWTGTVGRACDRSASRRRRATASWAVMVPRRGSGAYGVARLGAGPLQARSRPPGAGCSTCTPAPGVWVARSRLIGRSLSEGRHGLVPSPARGAARWRRREVPSPRERTGRQTSPGRERLAAWSRLPTRTCAKLIRSITLPLRGGRRVRRAPAELGLTPAGGESPSSPTVAGGRRSTDWTPSTGFRNLREQVGFAPGVEAFGGAATAASSRSVLTPCSSPGTSERSSRPRRRRGGHRSLRERRGSGSCATAVWVRGCRWTGPRVRPVMPCCRPCRRCAATYAFDTPLLGDVTDMTPGRRRTTFWSAVEQTTRPPCSPSSAPTRRRRRAAAAVSWWQVSASPTSPRWATVDGGRWRPRRPTGGRCWSSSPRTRAEPPAAQVAFDGEVDILTAPPHQPSGFAERWRGTAAGRRGRCRRRPGWAARWPTPGGSTRLLIQHGDAERHGAACVRHHRAGISHARMCGPEQSALCALVLWPASSGPMPRSRWPTAGGARRGFRAARCSASSAPRSRRYGTVRRPASARRPHGASRASPRTMRRRARAGPHVTCPRGRVSRGAEHVRTESRRAPPAGRPARSGIGPLRRPRARARTARTARARTVRRARCRPRW